MRAAIVTGDYYKSHETMVNRHIVHLFGGNSCVICSRHNGENPYDKEMLERRIDPWPLADRIALPFSVVSTFLKWRTSRVPMGPERRALLQFLKDQEVDFVLSEFGTQTVAVAPVVAEAGLPLIGYFRGADATKALRTSKRRSAYRRMVPQVTAFVAVSQFLLDQLADAGVHHPRSFVLPSGVDVRKFTPSKKVPNRFVTVGRFVPKKQPTTTVRAFCRAAKDHPTATLEMVGDGPLLAECQAIAAEMGMSERVIFRGALLHDGVRKALQRAEVFLQHSVIAKSRDGEGLPTSIQEAMASGAMVISTRHAGIPEAVQEGVTGYLVDEHDEAGFTDLIRRTLDGEIDRAACGAAGRKVAEEKFDNDKLLTRLEEIIAEVA